MLGDVRQRNFGTWVRLCREQHLWDVARLAALVGMEASTLCGIELGEVSPTLEQAQDLAITLGTTLSLLLADSPHFAQTPTPPASTRSTLTLVEQHLAELSRFARQCERTLVMIQEVLARDVPVQDPQ